MRTLEGRRVLVDDKPMAILKEISEGVLEVAPLPACSLATRLLIITELRDQGYTVV